MEVGYGIDKDSRGKSALGIHGKYSKTGHEPSGAKPASIDQRATCCIVNLLKNWNVECVTFKTFFKSKRYDF